jgi:hypothetical protein
VTVACIDGSSAETVYFQEPGAEYLEPVEQLAEFLLILK